MRKETRVLKMSQDAMEKSAKCGSFPLFLKFRKLYASTMITSGRCEYVETVMEEIMSMVRKESNIPSN